MSKNARAEAQRERQFYGRQDLQRCTVCGRPFVRRKDDICSMACAEKAKETLTDD